MSKQRSKTIPQGGFQSRWSLGAWGSERSLIPEAVLITLFIHGLFASALLTIDPDRHSKRVLHPLEVTLLTPPKALPPEPPPPPPPRLRPLVKPVVRPMAPPIQPMVIPDPEPVVSEEPPLPVAPMVEEEPPVEVPIVLPLYNADHLRNPPPPYPAIAKRLKIEGTVLVRVLVSPAGLPKKIELAHTSGAPVLDEAALKAVRNWAFVPARRGVEPVEAWVEIPINFHLRKNG